MKDELIRRRVLFQETSDGTRLEYLQVGGKVKNRLGGGGLESASDRTGRGRVSVRTVGESCWEADGLREEMTFAAKLAAGRVSSGLRTFTC